MNVGFAAVVEKMQIFCVCLSLELVFCRTVSDVTAGVLGVLIAAVSVASSAMQQILCRYYLRKHDVSANELLGTTAPLQVCRFFHPFLYH